MCCAQALQNLTTGSFWAMPNNLLPVCAGCDFAKVGSQSRLTQKRFGRGQVLMFLCGAQVLESSATATSAIKARGLCCQRAYCAQPALGLRCSCWGAPEPLAPLGVCKKLALTFADLQRGWHA